MNPKVMLVSLVLIEGCLLAETQSPRKARHAQPPAASLGEVGARPGWTRAGSMAGRPRELGAEPASRRILLPPPHPRCGTVPTGPYWQRRDLMAEIQGMARRGFIPVAKTDPEALEILDYTWHPSGWRAYSFLVAPKGTLHVRLHHSNEGWFRLVMFNKWGQLEEGMLGNRIPTGNPEVRYTNPKDEFHFVYVLVDDPGWMSSKENPYRLQIERSWDPKAEKPGEMQPVDGVWAQLDREKLDASGTN